MRHWIDTEFVDDGVTIDLLSIGIVSEDGRELYLESSDADHSRAGPWVREHVLPHLHGGARAMPRKDLARHVHLFLGPEPEVWGYYASYDWVALCQLFGTMMDLPAGWPMYALDVRQLQHHLGARALPAQSGTEHHALDDARWTRDAWLYLKRLEREFRPVSILP